MANTVGWVIPAISAGASLLGTVVGGLVGYWSSTKMHERSVSAEESRRRNAQLLDGAMAFIAGIENMGVGQLALARIAQEWGPKAAGLAAARTDEEILEAARAIHPTFSSGGGSRMQVMLQLARATGVFDDEVRRGTALLSEIRLLAPADVARSAQRVLYSALTAQLTGLAAPELDRAATFNYNESVNDFFNRVRHHMNVEDIDFSFVNEDLMLEVLALERDSERSGRRS